MSVKVFLGLGSNLGNRRKNLNEAIELIRKNQKIKIISVSSFYRTKPEEGVSGGNFLNAVLEIRTSLSARQLLAFTQSIERKLGSPIKKGGKARKIDIDILLYGQKIVRQKNLIIPHSRMLQRKFVLEPLAEISPQTIHPQKRTTIKKLLQDKR